MLYISNGVLQVEAYLVPAGIEACWEILPRVAKTGIAVPEWATFTCIEVRREPTRGDV